MSINNGTFPQCQVVFGRGEWADPAVPAFHGQQEVMGTPRPLHSGYDESVLLHGLGGGSHADSFNGSASGQERQILRYIEIECWVQVG